MFITVFRRTDEKMKNKLLRHILLFVGILLAGVLFFMLLVQKDNKYQWPGPRGENGITDLTGEWPKPFVFLTYGWEVYEDRLMSPKEIKEDKAGPDRYVFLGEYGGFEFGDAGKSPGGCATYRMNLILNQQERDYTMELPEIFSAYRLWINGQLANSAGEVEKESYRPETGLSFFSFSGSGEVELVVETANYTSFYSGMVYPPAFGETKAVMGMINIRLLTHCAAAFLAAMLSVICSFSGGGKKKRLVYGQLFFCCACYALYVSYPVIHTLNIHGSVWYTLEKLGIYGFILALCCLLGTMYEFPLQVRSVMFGAGLAACLLVAVSPCFLENWSVKELRFYSLLLSWWQCLAAGYIAAVGIWACKKGTLKSVSIMAGAAVFWCALFTNHRLLFEPVYTGWPAEWGGLAMIIIIAGILLSENQQAYRMEMELEKQIWKNEETLLMQSDYLQNLSQYLRRTGRINHESKKNLELLRYYYENKEYKKLGTLLEHLYQKEEDIKISAYTPNPLINMILSSRFIKAEESGITIRHHLVRIPPVIAMEDSDLCSLLANLLDNAIEGCERLSGEEKKWIAFGMQMKNDNLSIVIENSAAESTEEGGKKVTQKQDWLAHGHGGEIIDEIVEQYGGIKHLEWKNGVYSVCVTLSLVCINIGNSKSDGG